MNFNTVIVPIKSSDTITIIPIELHWSRRTKSNGFCNDTWKRLLKRVEKDDKCFIVFVGDMTDDDRPSMRQRKEQIYAETERHSALEESDLDHMDRLDKYLVPDLKRIQGKIIGMIDGDHYRRYANGITSTQYLANKLKCPKAYLGERMGWIRIIFQRDGSKQDHRLFDILIRHGKGGTGAFGYDINALVRQSSGFDADLYIGGHTHKQWFIKVPFLHLGKYDIKQRLVGYARAGSLLRGFLFGQTTYAEIAEYNPLSIGCPEIYISVGRPNHSTEITDIRGLT